MSKSVHHILSPHLLSLSLSTNVHVIMGRRSGEVSSFFFSPSFRLFSSLMITMMGLIIIITITENHILSLSSSHVGEVLRKGESDFWWLFSGHSMREEKKSSSHLMFFFRKSWRECFTSSNNNKHHVLMCLMMMTRGMMLMSSLFSLLELDLLSEIRNEDDEE